MPKAYRLFRAKPVFWHADPWHTNAVGYQVIARSLTRHPEENGQVKDYLRQAK
jgi:hypothetical protein